MHRLVFTIPGFLFAAIGARGYSGARCTAPALQHESRDVATIRRLEQAWNVAFLRGDETFERCLLTPDFTSIVADGRVTHLAEELALARANRDKRLVMPKVPPAEVLLRGDVAVAYGRSAAPDSTPADRRAWYADYYVWTNGAWHAYFAQQTVPIVKKRT